MFSSGPTSQSGLKRGLPLLDTEEIAYACLLGLALRHSEQASSPWHEVSVSPTHSSKLAMTRTRSSGGIMTLKSPGVYVGSISPYFPPCAYTDHETLTQFPQKIPQTYRLLALWEVSS